MLKFFLFVCLAFGGWQLYDRHQTKLKAQRYEVYRAELAQLDTKKGVTLFTASWCGYCAKLKERLNASNVPFTEYDIETSAHGEIYQETNTANGVPIVIVDGTTIVGYDMNRMPAAFANGGYRVTGL